jgi:peroxiredoxin Q/BCP
MLTHVAMKDLFPRSVFVSILAASLALACGTVKRPDGGVGLLPPGASAPEVVGVDAVGKEFRLSAARGKPVVVYFYPRDGTPGCTKEACAFRDVWAKFEKADVAIVGVSTNSAESHREFRKDHAIPFALAADESGSIGAAYGVSKKLWGYDRVTFLVGRDGKVAKVWPSVDPGVHAAEVLSEATRVP